MHLRTVFHVGWEDAILFALLPDLKKNIFLVDVYSKMILFLRDAFSASREVRLTEQHWQQTYLLLKVFG